MRLPRLGSNTWQSPLGTRDDEINAIRTAKTLTFAITGTPNPAGTSVTVTWSMVTTCGGSGDQSNLTITIYLDWPSAAPSAPSDTSLAGWTNSTGWEEIGGEVNQGWVATFTRATHVSGSTTLQFTASSGGATGTLISDLSLGASDQVAVPTMNETHVVVA